jgi:hypothetical protein
MLYTLYTYIIKSTGILFRPLVFPQNEFKTHVPYTVPRTTQAAQGSVLQTHVWVLLEV